MSKPAYQLCGSVYAVIGKFKHDAWPVCWRGLPTDAGAMVDFLEKDAEKFAAWKLKMQLNNSGEHYEDLIEKYVSTQMIDSSFVEGCEYVVWQLPDDPKQVA